MKYLHLCLGMGILFAQALSAGAAEEPKAALEELPALSLDDFGWIERDILGEIESGLDRTIPRVKRGDTLEFRSLSGLNVNAVYEYGAKDSFVIVQEGKEITLKFVDVPKAIRLKLDVSFRVRHMELEAKGQTRQILKAAGVVFPPLAINAGNEEKQEAFNMLDPLLHTRFARSQMSKVGDPWLGELHAGAAAQLGEPESMFAYALMLSQRGSPFYNPSDGLMYLAAASEARYREATEMINKTRVDSTLKNQALERYEAAKKQKEMALGPRMLKFQQAKKAGLQKIEVLKFQKIQ